MTITNYFNALDTNRKPLYRLVRKYEDTEVALIEDGSTYRCYFHSGDHGWNGPVVVRDGEIEEIDLYADMKCGFDANIYEGLRNDLVELDPRTQPHQYLELLMACMRMVLLGGDKVPLDYFLMTLSDGLKAHEEIGFESGSSRISEGIRLVARSVMVIRERIEDAVEEAGSLEQLYEDTLGDSHDTQLV